MLINFLSLSKELRDFCGLTRVPDAAQFTRFLHEFQKYLNLMFEKLVETTEPICQKISSELANIIIVDTTDIEGNINENSPKNPSLKTIGLILLFQETQNLGYNFIRLEPL